MSKPHKPQPAQPAQQAHKPQKGADAPAQPPAPAEAGGAPEGMARLRRDTRPQGPALKFHQKKADARRKLPSGPIGGSGRKTNVSRSS